MASRMDYIDAALDALAVVMPNEQPIRIMLQEILPVICFGWLDDREPSEADLARLQRAIEQAVAVA